MIIDQKTLCPVDDHNYVQKLHNLCTSSIYINRVGKLDKNSRCAWETEREMILSGYFLWELHLLCANYLTTIYLV